MFTLIYVVNILKKPKTQSETNASAAQPISLRFKAPSTKMQHLAVHFNENKY
jgi:hypothetical protein